MKKILIVDDEIHITKALCRELEPWCKEREIELISSNNSIDVPPLLKNDDDIFLLITDMMMPGLSGVDLSFEAKKINPDLLIIIMTGYAQIDVIVEAVGSGISALILKPWNMEYMLLNLGTVYQNYMLKNKEKKYKKMIEDDLKWGAELQRHLLKRDLPLYEDISFSIFYKPLPSFRCGGDYYDVIPIDDNRFFIICADVAGHGIRAAFITTILKSVIFSECIQNHISQFNPAEFLAWLNNRLIAELDSFPEIIITLSAFLVDLDDYLITYSNAGHLPFYLLHEEKLDEIRLDSTVLNFSPDLEYKEAKISVCKGDKFVIFTDGLIEIGKNNQMLESKRIKEEISRSFIAAEDAKGLYNRFRSLTDSDSFYDDVTIIITEFL